MKSITFTNFPQEIPHSLQAQVPSTMVAGTNVLRVTTNLEETTTLEASDSQSQLKKRVSRLLKKKENRICLDCSKSNPRWITILSIHPPHTRSSNHNHLDTYQLGGFCCLECSGAHRRLGTHLSFVRSMDLDTLKESDVQALECGGGNGTVNRIFEGKLFDTSISDTCIQVGFSKDQLKPDSSSNQKERELFIRNKYEKKAYVSLKELSQFRLAMRTKNVFHLTDLSSPESQNQLSPASSAEQQSPIKLQVFTSSPRTLAMIEKYMNPKPKRKKLGRMIRDSFRRHGPRSSRKSYFQKSLGGLQGIVDVNPMVTIMQTRSEEFDHAQSEFGGDKDSDVQSVSSTCSSMSAFLRRQTLKLQKGPRRYQHVSKDMHRTLSFPKPDKKRGAFKNTMNVNNNRKKQNHYKLEEELEVFDIKNEVGDDALQSPRSCKSPKLRLTPYLRTPKRKNGNTEVENPISDCSYKMFDNETSKYMGEKGQDHDDIKAMKDWSKSISKVISKMSKKGKHGEMKNREKSR